MERRIKPPKVRKLEKIIKSEKGTKLTRGRDLEMSGDMSNEHRKRGDISYGSISKILKGETLSRCLL